MVRRAFFADGECGAVIHCKFCAGAAVQKQEAAGRSCHVAVCVSWIIFAGDIVARIGHVLRGNELDAASDYAGVAIFNDIDVDGAASGDAIG